MSRSWRSVVALVAVVVGLAVTSAASAVTASVGTPDLIGRVALTVPLSVTCDAPSPGLVVFSQQVEVTVEQAAGKQIARGSAFVGNPFPELLFPCDGSPAAITIGVLADPDGPPFHGGRAVIRVRVRAEAGVPFPFSPGSFMGPFEMQTSDTGPLEVKLG